MLIRLNRPDLVEQIQSRFDARETGPRPSMELDDTIKLVLDVDSLTSYPAIQPATLTPTGTGLLTLLTVPDGERWEASNAYIYRTGGGADATFSEVWVSDGTYAVVLAAQTAAASFTWNPYKHLWLEAGWLFRVNLAAWTTGDVVVRLLTKVHEGY